MLELFNVVASSPRPPFNFTAILFSFFEEKERKPEAKERNPALRQRQQTITACQVAKQRHLSRIKPEPGYRFFDLGIRFAQPLEKNRNSQKPSAHLSALKSLPRFANGGAIHKMIAWLLRIVAFSFCSTESSTKKCDP